ncbi:MAG: non-homologous end-joining DNA ligase [bacterium]|nr:non-homologous end-joining DNA ligase [bacterium]
MVGVLGRLVRPMLARTSERAFDSPRHWFEVKWDGYRCLAFVENGVMRLQSRNLRDLTSFYPELAPLPGWVRAREAILDGELVAMRGARPDFGALQDRQGPVVYVVFDLLHRDGRDLMAESLEARREALREVVPACGTSLVFSEHVVGQGLALYRAVTDRGLEGIVAKEVASPYLPGERSRYWLKVRHRKVLEATIVGYTGIHPRYPRSLVLAVAGGDGLSYIGRVGTGYSGAEGEDLVRRLRLRADSPLADSGRVPGPVRWVEPGLRCRVEYTELTAEGLLRQPVYRGLVGGC